MKKIIAAILAGTCVASMAGLSAFAASTDEVHTIVWTGSGADKVYNDDGVALDANVTSGEFLPDKTIWIPMELLGDAVVIGSETSVKANTLGASFSDDDLFKKKFDKGDDDTKIIKKMSFEQKDVVKGGARENAIKVELNNDYTDNDYKISPEITFTAKEDIGSGIKKGDKLTIKFTAHVNNDTRLTDDETVKAGENGYVIKPVKDESNEIVWESEDGDIASLKFEADSDVDKYFPKLSTKWDNSKYESNFDGQDAYIFDFVGRPTISATSRPLLTIYNPYYDEDEDALTVAAEDVIIYEEMTDGTLVDVTAKFTATTNDDGDEVFTTKTRTLGTYIFATEAASDDAETPVDEETVDDGKTVPNTGR